MRGPEFMLAGAVLDWPIGAAAGMSNHPDIEVVAARIDNLASLGLAEVVGGSWKLGDAHGGNGYVRTEIGWEYVGGDEYPDPEKGAGYNAKALPGPGVDAGLERFGDLVDLARSKNTELSVSFSPHSDKPLEEIPELLEAGHKALRKGALRVEINLSCPNVPGRPPFSQDEESVLAFYQLVADTPTLVNRYGEPALCPKYGPFATDGTAPLTYYPPRYAPFGGLVTSNTVPNQIPTLPCGESAIRVNGGRAGMSGPALEEAGRKELEHWVDIEQRAFAMGTVPPLDIISVLGVASGYEVKRRLDMGADFVQIASVLYWPSLIGCETDREVVERLKAELVEAYEA